MKRSQPHETSCLVPICMKCPGSANPQTQDVAARQPPLAASGGGIGSDYQWARGFFSGGENVVKLKKLIAVMVAQLCDYIKNH